MNLFDTDEETAREVLRGFTPQEKLWQILELAKRNTANLQEKDKTNEAEKQVLHVRIQELDEHVKKLTEQKESDWKKTVELERILLDARNELNSERSQHLDTRTQLNNQLAAAQAESSEVRLQLAEKQAAWERQLAVVQADLYKYVAQVETVRELVRLYTSLNKTADKSLLLGSTILPRHASPRAAESSSELDFDLDLDELDGAGQTKPLPSVASDADDLDFDLDELDPDSAADAQPAPKAKSPRPPAAELLADAPAAKSEEVPKDLDELTAFVRTKLQKAEDTRHTLAAERDQLRTALTDERASTERLQDQNRTLQAAARHAESEIKDYIDEVHRLKARVNALESAPERRKLELVVKKSQERANHYIRKAEALNAKLAAAQDAYDLKRQKAKEEFALKLGLVQKQLDAKTEVVKILENEIDEFRRDRQNYLAWKEAQQQDLADTMRVRDLARDEAEAALLKAKDADDKARKTARLLQAARKENTSIQQVLSEQSNTKDLELLRSQQELARLRTEVFPENKQALQNTLTRLRLLFPNTRLAQQAQVAETPTSAEPGASETQEPTAQLLAPTSTSTDGPDVTRPTNADGQSSEPLRLPVENAVADAGHRHSDHLPYTHSQPSDHLPYAHSQPFPFAITHTVATPQDRPRATFLQLRDRSFVDHAELSSRSTQRERSEGSGIFTSESEGYVSEGEVPYFGTT
eukprot:TRINITY_DN6752_c0_g1_i1.p1 TRINITY_DN6752_c0_g1~~TRINITY_DN6752_c0_g1_i1.p1  ORF type:complete len:700 (-),score=133.58 TRINITY_DN6752_c0_g1_i1:809-2908(-)